MCVNCERALSIFLQFSLSSPFLQRLDMDAGNSIESLESILEEGHFQEIEMIGGISSAANGSLDLGTQGEEANGTELDVLDQIFTLKWAKTIFIMAYTGMLSLLGVFYAINNNGNLLPEPLKQHSLSFILFLILLMFTFYVAIIGVIFEEAIPIMGRTCNFIALVLFILSFTVLQWAFLPQNLSWAPWILFAVTFFSVFGVLFYRSRLHVWRILRQAQQGMDCDILSTLCHG